MNLKFMKNDDTLTVFVQGRIDMLTAPDFEVKVNNELEGVKNLILDFEGVEYLSSLGLRVILELQKKMSEKGLMTLRKVNKDIMDIFEITGFTNILIIEQ